MNAKAVKKWLQKIEDDEVVRVYIETEEEDLISPNMGYLLRDEIFDYQDQLDNIEYSNEGLTQLYLLTEDILSTIESRLALSPEFIKGMDNIHKKIENGDDLDFEEIKIVEESFYDLVYGYCEATKIGDVLRYCTLLIYFVKNRIKGVECDIHDGRLWITSKNNASCSTSIISELLNIKASNIDDKDWKDGVWSIQLHN